MAKVLAWRYGNVIAVDENAPVEDEDGWPSHAKIQNPDRELRDLEAEIAEREEKLARQWKSGIRLTDTARRRIEDEIARLKDLHHNLEKAVLEHLMV